MSTIHKQEVTIAIADDHELFRLGMRHLFAYISYTKLIVEASNGQELIERLAEKNVDIVFMDIQMPVLDGIEASIQVKKRFPQTKIIALTSFSDEEYISRMLDSGANGFMLKSASISEIKTAIETVSKGNSFFSQELFSTISKMLQTKEKPPTPKFPEISIREREVLKLLCRGQDTQEIANELFISPRTVEKHKANLMAKTNTQTTLQLVVFALRQRIVSLPTT